MTSYVHTSINTTLWYYSSHLFKAIKCTIKQYLSLLYLHDFLSVRQAVNFVPLQSQSHGKVITVIPTATAPPALSLEQKAVADSHHCIKDVALGCSGLQLLNNTPNYELITNGCELKIGRLQGHKIQQNRRCHSERQSTKLSTQVPPYWSLILTMAL